jgi:hypothetical protein
MVLHELKAETDRFTFEIGNFETKEEALKAATDDKKSPNGIYCTTGSVEYWFDEEKIL